jgi:hypothetical protein
MKQIQQNPNKLWLGVIVACAIAVCGLPTKSFAVNSTSATDAYNDFNSAFMDSAGDGYNASLSSTTYDYFWAQAEDIELVEDRYEVTHSATEKNLVNTMCNKFVVKYTDTWIPTDTWNDDLGRSADMLTRAYIITGTASFLAKAKLCFDTAYQRGWDTTSNGGGIWEQQGVANPRKEALSTLSCGYAAALLATVDANYSAHATTIYSWARTHLFNPATGQVYNAVYPDGSIDMASTVSNQGSMIDYARLLYKSNSGNQTYFNDATASVVYTKANHTDGSGFIDSCAAQFSRGMGHFVVDNNLWNTTFSSGTSYYSWMYSNCNTGWGHRRTDKNVTWNRINTATPVNNTDEPYDYEGVPVLLQYTFMPH